jgi:hypothetical protein
VFIHVGSPKTGTTFVQNVLWSQRELAAEQGLHLPQQRFDDHYLATVDLREMADRPEHPPRALGMWDRVVADVEGGEGTWLVSHELFAAATADQARRAVESFGPDTEVHVVLTARDLVRQIPAEWQEHVKHRYTKTLAQFVTVLRKDKRGKTWFWRVQDFASVLERWGAALPPSHVHVVTVPPAGSDSSLLWTRFAGLLGLDPAAFDTSSSRANTSLGVEQAELLRRVNAALGDRLPLPGPYPGVVKNLLAHTILAGHPGTPLALDQDAIRFAVERSAGIAQRLAASGFDVVGDLADLVPDEAAATARAAAPGSDTPSDEVLLAESVAVIADLLDSVRAERQRRRRIEDLAREVQSRPLKSVAIAASERYPSVMRLRHGYWRTVNAGRRLARRRPS